MTKQMTMIEIQQAYIDRVVPAYLRITERTKGRRAQRTKAAAHREALGRLVRLGFTEANAEVVIKDAQDIAILEISACN
jgi:hypothetical protein